MSIRGSGSSTWCRSSSLPRASTLRAELAQPGCAGRSCRAARRARAARGRRRPRRAGRPRRRPAAPAPTRDQVVGALEVVGRAHRRAEDRRARATRSGAAPPAGSGPRSRRRRRSGPRGPPRRASASTSPRRRARRRRRRPPPVSSRTRAGDVVGVVVQRLVGAELARARELRVARRGDDRRAPPSAFAIASAAVATPLADPPDQHPLAGLAGARLRHEHPVGGLEDERERGRLLEREAVRESGGRRCAARRPARRACRRGARRARGSRPSCARPGLITTRSSGARDHAGAVGAEDARLRHRRAAPCRSQTSRWLSEAARSSTSTSPGPGTGSGTSS